MKLVMVIVLSLLSLYSRAVAQVCTTNAECAAQRAYANEQMKAFAEQTTEAKAEATADRKTAVAMSWTPTPQPSATNESTATPTRTQTPQPTNAPTMTPLPTATSPDLMATVAQRVVAIVPTSAPRPPATQGERITINILAGLAVLIVIVAVSVLLFKPQTFILRNRNQPDE